MSYQRTPETIKKMVESRRKNPKFAEHLRKMNAARKGTKLSEEHKAKIAAAGIGRVVTPETRIKISLIHKGKMISDTTRLRISKSNKGKPKLNNRGIKNGQWKGDNAKYRAVHAWVDREKGRTNICRNCDVRAKTHWANISGQYHRELSDFIELCVSCHRRYDLKQIQLRITT